MSKSTTSQVNRSAVESEEPTTMSVLESTTPAVPISRDRKKPTRKRSRKKEAPGKVAAKPDNKKTAPGKTGPEQSAEGESTRTTVVIPNTLRNEFSKLKEEGELPKKLTYTAVIKQALNDIVSPVEEVPVYGWIDRLDSFRQKLTHLFYRWDPTGEYVVDAGIRKEVLVHRDKHITRLQAVPGQGPSRADLRERRKQQKQFSIPPSLLRPKPIPNTAQLQLSAAPPTSSETLALPVAVPMSEPVTAVPVEVELADDVTEADIMNGVGAMFMTFDDAKDTGKTKQ